MPFTIKDSGARAEFAGGMVRDTEEGKLDWSNLRVGPMPRRIVAHLTAGRKKYPDPSPGIPNWTLGRGLDVWLRARASFSRHNDAWLAGQTDEDHAAAIYFNVNVAEYVRQFFTDDEEAQAQKVEALQAEDQAARLAIKERAERYIRESDAKRMPVQTGRRLLTLKALEDIRDAVDGTGLDRHGDALPEEGLRETPHL